MVFSRLINLAQSVSLWRETHADRFAQLIRRFFLELYGIRLRFKHFALAEQEPFYTQLRVRCRYFGEYIKAGFVPALTEHITYNPRTHANTSGKISLISIF